MWKSKPPQGLSFVSCHWAAKFIQLNSSAELVCSKLIFRELEVREMENFHGAKKQWYEVMQSCGGSSHSRCSVPSGWQHGLTVYWWVANRGSLVGQIAPCFQQARDLCTVLCSVLDNMNEIWHQKTKRIQENDSRFLTKKASSLGSLKGWKLLPV